jgi:hypothetical protein
MNTAAPADQCTGTTATTWRAFIGEWEGTRTHTDTRGISWLQACQILIDFAKEEIDAQTEGEIPCQHCLTAARDTLADLTRLAPGTPWAGEIDWDELKLLPEDPSS